MPIPFRTMAQAALMAQEEREKAARFKQLQEEKMTDQPTTPESEQPAPLPNTGPTVEELVNEALVALPTLNTVRSDLERVMRLHSTYIGSEEIQVIPVDRSTALDEVSLIQGIGLDEIQTSCDNVMAALAEELEALSKAFSEATGTEVDSIELVTEFNERYVAERREQAELVRLAQNLLQLVTQLSGVLGIDIQPNAPSQPTPATQSQVAPTVPGNRLHLSALFAWAIEQPQPETDELGDEPLTTPAVEASWTTPPILNPDSEELRRLKLVQNRVAAAKGNLALAISTLDNMSLNKERLTDLLNLVASMARDQIRQSQEIESRVGVDYKDYEARAASVQDVRQIILAIHNFFNPPTGDTASAKR